MVSRLLLSIVDTQISARTMRSLRTVEMREWPMILVDDDWGIFTHEGEIVGYSRANIVPHWKVNRNVMDLNKK